MHLPSTAHGTASFLWAVFFGLLIWLGGSFVGYSSGRMFILGCVAGFLIFLFVNAYGDDDPRTP